VETLKWEIITRSSGGAFNAAAFMGKKGGKKDLTVAAISQGGGMVGKRYSIQERRSFSVWGSGFNHGRGNDLSVPKRKRIFPFQEGSHRHGRAKEGGKDLGGGILYKKGGDIGHIVVKGGLAGVIRGGDRAVRRCFGGKERKLLTRDKIHKGSAWENAQKKTNGFERGGKSRGLVVKKVRHLATIKRNRLDRRELNGKARWRCEQGETQHRSQKDKEEGGTRYFCEAEKRGRY